MSLEILNKKFFLFIDTVKKKVNKLINDYSLYTSDSLVRDTIQDYKISDFIKIPSTPTLVKTSKITVKPGDSKENDFSLSLADYFMKELKTAELNPCRKDACVEVNFNGLYMNRYDRCVIDCIDGKLYLRGKDVKDRYWGKLRRFQGNRKSDSYHCIAQSGTRTINRIKKVIESLRKEDKRKNKIIKSANRILEKKAKRKNIIIAAIERIDHRKIQALVRNGNLIAKRMDNRKKKIVIIDRRKIK